MTFQEYVQELSNERAEFVKRIAKITLSTESTVSRWISGEFIPSKARREIIAKEMGVSVDELFPLNKS